MKITRCKYGHYYDKGYFLHCPHCNKEETGWENAVQDDLEKEKKNAERGMNQKLVQELGCEVQAMINEQQSMEKVEKEHDNDIIKRNLKEQTKSNLMIMASMPAKVMKNQEFCIDFCSVVKDEWKEGADMLIFKNREGSRDLKLVPIKLPAYGRIVIQYKEEVLFQSEEMLFSEEIPGLYTFPVCVTDNRDRRFHMIKVLFMIEEQQISVPLYLNSSI